MQEEKLEKEYPWPTIGDVLFAPGDSAWEDALVNWPMDNGWARSEGFYLGAKLLAETIDGPHSDQDTLLYPIAFLYRHYVELSLKQIVRDGNRLFGEEDDYVGENVKKTLNHSLTKYWSRCKAIYQAIWPQGRVEELLVVENCIKEFDNYDPNAQGFRYDTDRDGNPTLNGLNRVGVRRLAHAMEGLHSFLGGGHDEIIHLLEIKQEIDSENRSCCG